MKKNALYSISLISFMLLAQMSFAQGSNAWKRYRHDFTVGYGFNNMLATLGEKDNLGLAFALQRSSMSFSYRYFILNHVSVRAQFAHLYCRKNDKDLNRDSRENLRIDYETSMTEFGFMGEYHLFDETVKAHSGRTSRARGGIARFAKYGVSFYAGVDGAYFRPYGEYLGNRVYLTPVNDNPGYNTNVSYYKNFNIVFPVGTNVRLVLSENWRIGVDLGYRFGFNSYINDESSVYFDKNVNLNSLPSTSWPDSYYAGKVFFGKENQSTSQLSLQSGRRGYFLGLVTLSYRLKTR